MALIGSHATVTGGLATGGLAYAAAVGAEVIQVFVSNPRGWATGPGDTVQDRTLRESGLPVFIHAPYLINLGSGDPSVAQKSADAIAHALRRGGEIGARGVVVHTGSATAWTDGAEGTARERALRQIREIVLPLLDKLSDDDPDLLFEPMAGQGQMLCARAGDLAEYLDALERHPRAAVCLDTCHLFAAGHDLTAQGGVRDDARRNPHGGWAWSRAACARQRFAARLWVQARQARGNRLWHDRREPFRELLAALPDVPFVVETPGGKAGHARDIATLKELR